MKKHHKKFSDDILKNIQILWDYNNLNHKIEKSDCIVVLGSHDTRVAERGAELFLDKYAPYILFSGNIGRLTYGIFDEPEADKFAKIAIEMGVPENRIIIENKSTNTGENLLFSYKLLKKANIPTKNIILVQKPYMQRRAYCTFKKQWPDKKSKVFVTSFQISLEEYPNEKISLENAINIIVGDTQRIMLYPKKGFAIPQKIPKKVLESFKYLVKKGFTKHLIK